MAKLGGRGRGGGEQFLRTPAEVDYGRRGFKKTGKAGWGLLPFPPLSD